jgi:hypothetical protein
MMVHVQAHVGLLVSLLDSPQPDSLRHRVASAAAEAAGFAAWLWYDLGDLYTTSHCYRQAGLAAKESSNAGLRSYILGYQGLVARAQGRPESAPTRSACCLRLVSVAAQRSRLGLRPTVGVGGSRGRATVWSRCCLT